MPAVVRQGPLHLRRTVREHRSDFGTGFKEPGSLAIDDLEVPLLGGLRIMRVHELQHFALGDDVGASAMMASTRWLPRAAIIWKARGVDEIADQHACLVAEDLVGGIPPAAHRGAVHHIVMQQRGGMNEFYECRSFNVSVAAVVAGPAGQHHQQRPQAFAAPRNDVFGNPVDQGNRSS